MSSEETDDLGFELPAPAKTSRAAVIAGFAVVVGGLLVFGYVRREHARADVAAPSTDTNLVKVEVIHPTALSSDHALELPGTANALEQTKIYPRAPGYVRKWLVDIGDKVKEGQLLAEIETPDLDAQLAQARAQLAQAKAAVAQAQAQSIYSSSNAVRYQGLSDQHLVAQQTVDQDVAQAATDKATVAANQANVVAQQANVQRLVELTAFSKVYAPFAGTITARTIDRGTLVTDTGTTPMFTIAATDPIRIFVDIPQTVAPSVRDGTEAKVTVQEYPGRTFVGKVTRSAGALDPDLHLMTTELQVPNADGALLPGMYVTASILLPVPHQVTEIPSTALYNDSQGLRVATVDGHNKVHYARITIERDTGGTLWVGTGVTTKDRVIKLAVPTLVEGDIVDATDVAKPGEASAAKPAK
ncbi:MAG TPA: efflux RND transporter periplasmic adaptor subunit [Kofleriaceae bacterium]